MDGSIIRYNWVHGCNSAKGVTEKTTCKGIRGDDQSQGLTVHHNVVWDIDQYGIIVKGDRNRLFNNTVLDIKSNKFVMLPVNPEPYRLWWEQYPLRPSQNANTLVFNNVTRTIVNRKGAFTEGRNVGNNFTGDADPKLVNPAQFDFRPGADSPLIDAGRVIDGIADNFKGKTSDIGAYERGGRYWKPGINWSEN